MSRHVTSRCSAKYGIHVISSISHPSSASGGFRMTKPIRWTCYKSTL